MSDVPRAAAAILVFAGAAIYQRRRNRRCRSLGKLLRLSADAQLLELQKSSDTRASRVLVIPTHSLKVAICSFVLPAVYLVNLHQQLASFVPSVEGAQVQQTRSGDSGLAAGLVTIRPSEVSESSPTTGWAPSALSASALASWRFLLVAGVVLGRPHRRAETYNALPTGDCFFAGGLLVRTPAASRRCGSCRCRLVPP